MSLDLLNSLIIIGLGIFLKKYLDEKAKNFATKEDVENITAKIEIIKAGVGSQQYIHQFRYQNEFNIFLDLSEKLVSLKDTVLALRPEVDYLDFKNLEEERKKRLKEFGEAALPFIRFYESRKPFYTDEIYINIKKLIGLIKKEVIQYKYDDKDDHKKYWEAAALNARGIVDLTDVIQDQIRTRVKYWENFEFKK